MFEFYVLRIQTLGDHFSRFAFGFEVLQFHALCKILGFDFTRFAITQEIWFLRGYIRECSLVSLVDLVLRVLFSDPR